MCFSQKLNCAELPLSPTFEPFLLGKNLPSVPFCIDQPLPAHGSSFQKKRDSFVWSLVETVHAHDTPLAPHLAGLREGFTSSSQKHQGWPLQLAGLRQPPSHQALIASGPPHLAPSSQPWRGHMPSLDPQVPTSILSSGNNPPSSPAALSKWI